MTNSAPPEPQDRETEQKILDAARSVFIRRGTAGARMRSEEHTSELQSL